MNKTTITLSGKKFIVHEFPHKDLPRLLVDSFKNWGRLSKKDMLKILSYASLLNENGTELELDTEEIVNKHVVDHIMLIDLIREILTYNSDLLKEKAEAIEAIGWV